MNWLKSRSSSYKLKYKNSGNSPSGQQKTVLCCQKYTPTDCFSGDSTHWDWWADPKL